MQLIPVLDIQNGAVVHAVAGDRSKYQPIQSQLCQGSEPVDVGRALLRASGSDKLYVADLDALGGQAVQQSVILELAELGVEIWLDIGLANAQSGRDWDNLFSSHVEQIRPIVASETIQTLDSISAIADRLGTGRIVLSLDLYEGKLRSNSDAIGRLTPLDFANLAVKIGIESMIVLELSRVGTSSGLTDCDAIGALVGIGSALNLFWGGGICHAQDMRIARDLGFSGVLVATALHRKAITQREIFT